MSVFGKYSHYYNLLYKDKDYAGEARYIHDIIRQHAPGAQSVLDLGCGTGRHDFELARLGYEVTGVDMSAEMLAAARSRLAAGCPNLSSERPCPLNFHSGDIRNVRLNRTFDVVVSLFHVMSYQLTNEDLQAAIYTAGAHLKPGGLFIFDFWYGPAVLTDQPVVRIKRLEDDEISVTRIAEPVMHFNENVVDVNYDVLITDKATGTMERLQETHRMRYLFIPEIERLYDMAGMKSINFGEWLGTKPAGKDTWGVIAVARFVKAL
jgi:SAM-dependent methyltransferase